MTLLRLAATSWMRGPPDLRAIGTLVGAPHRVLGALSRPSLAPALSRRLSTPTPLASLVDALRGRVVVTNPCATSRLPDVVGALARAVLRPTLRATPRPTPHPTLDATPGPSQAPNASTGPLHDGALPAFSPVPTAAPAPERADARDATDARRRAALLDALPPVVRVALDPLDVGAQRWAAVALYEPAALDVRFADTPYLPPPVAPAPSPMVASPRYRLALIVGADDGAGLDTTTTWTDVDRAVRAAPAVPWPIGGRDALPWFSVRLLVTDAIATDGMDPGTLARWAAMTGRAGPASRDTYWYAETWDRFREPSRRVGHVTPAYVACSRRVGRAPTPAAPSAFDAAPFATTGGLALTPDAERGICVPPGYCLVDCVGTLEIAVVVLA